VTHDAEKLPGHLLNGNWHHIAITTMRKHQGSLLCGCQIATNVSAAALPGKMQYAHGAVTLADTYGFVLGAGTSTPTSATVLLQTTGSSHGRAHRPVQIYNIALSASDIQALYNGKE